MATVSFYGVLGAKCPAGDGYGQFVVYYVQKEETAKKKKKKTILSDRKHGKLRLTQLCRS